MTTTKIFLWHTPRCGSSLAFCGDSSRRLFALSIPCHHDKRIAFFKQFLMTLSCCRRLTCRPITSRGPFRTYNMGVEVSRGGTCVALGSPCLKDGFVCGLSRTNRRRAIQCPPFSTSLRQGTIIWKSPRGVLKNAT